MSSIETDYLIVGTGAVGMAFADTLLSETDATMILVDRYPAPGGHWNVAYPFVTLHQPSQFYGVPSKELSRGQIDTTGLNRGLYELATGAEIMAYFNEVLQQRLLPSGRVQYFPMCSYRGNHQFVSSVTGAAYQVTVRKKLVDCTFLNTSVPSTHEPNFSVANGVPFMPLNDLPRLQNAPERFVVIGGGKTGIDALLWLLENGVDPHRIVWIKSRDAWLLDRQNTQPTDAFFDKSLGTQARQMEAIARASSVEDLFDRLETAGALVRIYENVRPSMFHGATISQLELAELRRIQNVVRLGRVQRIESDRIVLERGEIPTSLATVHVDCSASAIPNLTSKPVFADGVVTPQTVRPYQPVFSASVVAYVEAHYSDEKTQNELCSVVRLPNKHTDWLPMTLEAMQNQLRWSQDKELRRWIRDNRLDGFGRLVREVDRTDADKMAILKQLKDHAFPAALNLRRLVDSLS